MAIKWGLSVYGEHNKTIMLEKDTDNGLISRLGVYNSLPMVIDEMTNIEGMALSDIVYRITQGRDKVRLNQNAKEKENLNYWQTLAVVACNVPGVIEKLTHAKVDASAEINRVFEYPVAEHPRMSQPLATRLYNVFSANYGHAGEIYIKYLVATQDVHAAKINTLIEHIQRKVESKQSERYWVAAIAAVIYGGLLARQLNLIEFDVAPVLAWACDQLLAMRDVKGDQTRNSDATAILAEFIDAHSNGRIVVDIQGKSNANKLTVIVKEPRAPLCMRQELGDGDVDLLYISRRTLTDWLGKKGISYSAFKRVMVHDGILVNDNRRKNMGAGTEYTGAPTPCWTIRLDSAALKESGIRKSLLQEVHGELAG